MNTLNGKSSVKSVAADQIKRACQNYSGGCQPAPLYATALPAEKFANIQVELNEMESTI